MKQASFDLPLVFFSHQNVFQHVFLFLQRSLQWCLDFLRSKLHKRRQLIFWSKGRPPFEFVRLIGFHPHSGRVFTSIKLIQATQHQHSKKMQQQKRITIEEATFGLWKFGKYVVFNIWWSLKFLFLSCYEVTSQKGSTVVGLSSWWHCWFPGTWYHVHEMGPGCNGLDLMRMAF